MAKVDWNQDEHGVSTGFETMPKGRYLAIVVDSEDLKTKDKTGRRFEFEFQIISPKEFKNRKLWHNFNVHNNSETAQRIGREQFNSLADCCGMLGKVQKTEQLHDKTVILIVGIKPAEGQYKEQNEILGFQKYEGPAPSARPTEAKTAERKTPPPAETKKPAGKFDDMEDDIPF